MNAEIPVYKKGNRFPYIEGTIKEEGEPINAESPTNAVAVYVLVKQPGGTVVKKTAEWVSKKEGKWRYKQTKADVEAAGALFEEGTYEIEVQVEWELEIIENIPNEGFKTFKIEAIL